MCDYLLEETQDRAYLTPEATQSLPRRDGR